ncbi:MAG: hypothetical protein WBK20_08020 [Spirochaetota bacterium]
MFNNNSYLEQLIFRYNLYLNFIKNIFDSIFTKNGIYYNDKINDVYEKLLNTASNLYDEIQKNTETCFSDPSILIYLPSRLNNFNSDNYPFPLYSAISSSDSDFISRFKNFIEEEFKIEFDYLSSLKSSHGLNVLEYKLDQQEMNFFDYCKQTLQEYILEKNEYIEKLNNYFDYALNKNNKDGNFNNNKYTFYFIKDECIKTVLALDYNELQKAYRHNLYKTTIIFVVSIIEGILIYSLLQSEKEALKSFKKIYNNEKQNDIKQWKMHQILDVAKDIGIIEKLESKVICYLKDYRNLVHPYSTKSNDDLKINHRTASRSLTILDMIYESVCEYIQKLDANNI